MNPVLRLARYGYPHRGRLAVAMVAMVLMTRVVRFAFMMLGAFVVVAFM